jgi:hypothetical protein
VTQALQILRLYAPRKQYLRATHAWVLLMAFSYEQSIFQDLSTQSACKGAAQDTHEHFCSQPRRQTELGSNQLSDVPTGQGQVSSEGHWYGFAAENGAVQGGSKGAVTHAGCTSFHFLHWISLPFVKELQKVTDEGTQKVPCQQLHGHDELRLIALDDSIRDRFGLVGGKVFFIL